MPAPAAPTTAGEVIVDDRLATVLATPVSSAAAARTQYRQLLDLLGRTPPDLAPPGPALARLAELERALSADECAQLIRATPRSLRHPGLILRLAAGAPVVAAAAIAAGQLDDWQWSALALELPLAARGHLRHRRDLGPRTQAVLTRLGIGDMGLPAPANESADETAAEPVLDLLESAADTQGIAAIVRRIEAFRRSREAGTRQFGDGGTSLDRADPLLPLSDEPHPFSPPTPPSIRFAAAADGRIAWAEASFAAMLAGLPLAANDPLAPARADAATTRAIRERRPVNGGRLDIDGAPAVAGAWRIDAAPRFETPSGRFLGYRGVLRRPAAPVAEPADTPADRLRQLLHELRTPVNAIQGFAELIQQQLFGPTPHQYRSLAAGIAADSAAVLAGFEEIDRLVKFETGRGEALVGTSDLIAVLTRLLAHLAPAIAPREVSFGFDATDRAPVAMAGEELERTLWRLLATLAAAALPGEELTLDLAAEATGVALALALPQSLQERDDAALFAVEPAADGASALGLLGGGFALRLARAEARAAGGGLVRDGARLVLHLPGLTPAAQAHSPAVAPRAGGARGT